MAEHTPADSHQLQLLAASAVPLQFRLDRATRQLGLAKAAEMRSLLAEQAARRQRAAGPVVASDAA
jgi:hypothetical protein